MKKSCLVLMLMFCAAAAIATGCGDEGSGTLASPTIELATRADGTWTELKPVGDRPRAYFDCSLVYDFKYGRMILFGGYYTTYYDEDDFFPDEYGDLNETWSYNPATGAWAQLKPEGDLPSPRMSSRMAYEPASGKILLFGGWDYESEERLLDTWTYDPAANAWTELDPSGDIPSDDYGMTMFHDPASGKIILLGAGTSNEDFSVAWEYDLGTNTWTKRSVTGEVPSPRISSASAFDPITNRLILFGGYYYGTSLRDTFAYDPATSAWTALDPVGDLPPARSAHCMAYDPSGKRIILFGGDDERLYEGWVLDDTWAYDLAANTWTELHPVGVPPSARMDHQMLTGSNAANVILFGGYSPAEHFEDIWAYDLKP